MQPSETSPAPATTASPAPPPPHAPSHTPVHASSATGKWILALALLLAIGLAFTFFLISGRRATTDKALETETSHNADAPQPVDVVRVDYGASSHRIPLPGEVRAWFETPIYARVNGYLNKWCVDIGDKVQQGQVLATIETPELDQQLSAAEAKVQESNAQVKLAQANVHFSQVTGARYKDAPKGVVSDLERDERESDYQVSQAKLTAAQSELNSAQAEVDRLHAMIAFQKVTAPFDGIITERNVDIGDLVTAGSTSSTHPLFQIAQSDKLRVFVDVPQSAIPDIHDGDKAQILPQEYPGKSFTGVVARNARSINSAAKTLRVEVDVPNTDSVLLPGMYVKVDFIADDQKPRLQIPASALNFRSGGPEVALVSKDNRITFRNVTIARDLGNFVEISEGLSPGDRVALNISNQIADGDRVAPNEVETQPAPTTPIVEVVAPTTIAGPTH